MLKWMWISLTWNLYFKKKSFHKGQADELGAEMKSKWHVVWSLQEVCKLGSVTASETVLFFHIWRGLGATRQICNSLKMEAKGRTSHEHQSSLILSIHLCIQQTCERLFCAGPALGPEHTTDKTDKSIWPYGAYTPKGRNGGRQTIKNKRNV